MRKTLKLQINNGKEKQLLYSLKNNQSEQSCMKKLFIIFTIGVIFFSFHVNAYSESGAHRRGKKRQRAHTFFFDVSRNKVNIHKNNKTGEYVSRSDVKVAASSLIPWEIYCIPTPPVSKQGHQEPGIEMKILPSKDPQHPERPFRGGWCPFRERKLFAKGQPFGHAREVNSFQIGATVAANVAPGKYHGFLQFFMGPQGDQAIPGPSVRYQVHVKGFVQMHVDKTPLSFVALKPGDVISRNTTRVVVLTNRDDVVLQVGMSPLQHETIPNQYVPQNVTTLGLGLTPDAAWRQAKNARLGDYVRQTPPLKRGRTEIFTAGRLRTDMSMPAGEYHGNLNITAQPRLH